MRWLSRLLVKDTRRLEKRRQHATIARELKRNYKGKSISSIHQLEDIDKEIEKEKRRRLGEDRKR